MTRDPFMDAALEEARASLAEGGIPIGSVLVVDGSIVARGHNKRVQNDSQILHAEIDCLQNAGRGVSYHRATLYSTLEPCYLCSGASVQFGIPRVVIGESRNFKGGADFMREHGIEVVDLDDPDCIAMMRDFIAAQPALWNEDIGVEE